MLVFCSFQLGYVPFHFDAVPILQADIVKRFSIRNRRHLFSAEADRVLENRIHLFLINPVPVVGISIAMSLLSPEVVNVRRICVNCCNLKWLYK